MTEYRPITKRLLGSIVLFTEFVITGVALIVFVALMTVTVGGF